MNGSKPLPPILWIKNAASIKYLLGVKEGSHYKNYGVISTNVYNVTVAAEL